ncbi:Uncharacterized protein APZ42_010654, partial [Daphnia magna]
CSVSECDAGDRFSIPDEVMNYFGLLTRNSRSYIKQVFIEQYVLFLIIK